MTMEQLREQFGEVKVRNMRLLTGSSRNWQPVMTANTTTSSYWLNWRVLLCGVWVIASTIFAAILLWKYEDFRNSRQSKGRGTQTQQENAATLYEDDVWMPCLKGVHPGWLLAFRAMAFVVLLSLLIATGLVDGGTIFYYYTQWTFSLVTIYFGLGSLLSMYGCFQYRRIGGERIDSEVGSEPGYGDNSQLSNAATKSSVPSKEHVARKPAGTWAYIFQIIFQINAGAVMLTDCVFWFILVPFLAIKDYNLNFLLINMHSINAVFLLGDTAMNCLRFPWFRIAYFFLWTIGFVTFQWILHACIPIWWPYPFLDLSSSYAPLWYSSVAFMHIPCYGVFALIVKLKHHVLSKKFPETYQCPR